MLYSNNVTLISLTMAVLLPLTGVSCKQKNPKIFCNFFTQEAKPLGHGAAENVKPAVSCNISQISCILPGKLVLDTYSFS